ncbi:hypothetical protein CH254_19640 [Rhodococcus sp. 06-412-2C]|uniref:hypothetical protein n=1 Tax=unclassified Rhodococcus (in: high G+C Gram-positive bacteria) TaxID=192944 RepID=UPI000B9BA89B|nr:MULTISPECIES: hypothetical protein [unclassified Rhodococcus (in: high G+C Gram-positive bacteria)]OZC84929.1 hypothetical protein CH254_19640 [Rhodococcus sp. 06-412-2C]OZC98670.1 hypothetical protein CH279_12285 [Rhodococcus sp. 06-412-2B]
MPEGRRYDAIIDASVIVTVVALGVVSAGLLRSPESAVAVSDSEVVSEPIEYPVDIPGCSEVEPPPSSEGEAFMTSSIVQGSPSYDNPDYPWLTSGKAGAMSDAVLAALPGDVSIRLATPSMSLVFQPVEDDGDDAPVGLQPSTDAMGELERSGTSAFASISVRPSDIGVPACVAGALDARTTQSDGTVIDTDDSWYEYAGDRTNFRTATAYHPDGTQVIANLTGTESAEFPLEQSEMARIASLPELRVTVPAPEGSVAPRQDCYIAAQGSGTELDVRPEAVAAANDALTAAWQAIPNVPELDRPIGSLVPGGYSSGVCTDLEVVGTRVGLYISVSGGVELPVALDPYDPESAYGPVIETRTLPDGSVVESYDADIVNSFVSEDGTTQLTRSVTVTRPSGVQVSVRSTVDLDPTEYAPLVLPEPLPFEVLDAVAQAPIAQWP